MIILNNLEVTDNAVDETIVFSGVEQREQPVRCNP